MNAQYKETEAFNALRYARLDENRIKKMEKAAPAMYEALKEVTDFIRIIKEIFDLQHMKIMSDNASDYLKRIQDAISAAEGRK